MSGLIVNGRRYQRKNNPGDHRSRPPIYDAPLARIVRFSTLVMGCDAERTLLAAARLLISRRQAAGLDLGWDSAIRRVREIEATERKIRGDDPANYILPDTERGVSILEKIAKHHGYAGARYVLVMALTDRLAGSCDEPEVLWECNLAAQFMVACVERGFQHIEELAAEIERVRTTCAVQGLTDVLPQRPGQIKLPTAQ
jgi:hypothetical protein